MIRYDAVIIGTTPTAFATAQKLLEQSRSVAVLASPHAHDAHADYFWRKVLARPHALPASFFPAPLATLPAGAELLSGRAKLNAARQVVGDAGPISARQIIIASGVTPPVLALPGLEPARVLSPYEALESVVGSAVVVGGGPTGVCVAEQLAQRGARVVIVTNAALLPREDSTVSAVVESRLRRQGVLIYTNSHPRSVTTGHDSRALTFDHAGETKTEQADALILATGNSPNSADMDLRSCFVFVRPDGSVAVTENMRTSTPGVWAVGTVTDPTLLPAMEAFQIELVAHNARAPFWDQKRLEPGPRPTTLPLALPLARLGDTEKEAREKDRHALAATLWLGQEPEEGFIKIIAKRNGELLGVHILAPDAEALILYFDLALRAGIPLFDLTERDHYPAFTPAEAAHRAIAAWVSEAG